MTKRQIISFSAVAGVVFASVVGPVLIALDAIQPLVLFSVVGVWENALMSAFTVGFSIAVLVLNKWFHDRWYFTPAGIVFFLLSLQGSLVMGISSLALLWLIPWWMYQFDSDVEAGLASH